MTRQCPQTVRQDVARTQHVPLPGAAGFTRQYLRPYPWYCLQGNLDPHCAGTAMSHECCAAHTCCVLRLCKAKVRGKTDGQTGCSGCSLMLWLHYDSRVDGCSLQRRLESHTTCR
jgi:hypothetical protein